MNTVSVNRPETGKSLAETYEVLGSEAAERTHAANISADHESLNRKENGQQYLGPEQEEEVLAEQEQSQSRSLFATETRNQAKEKTGLQDMVERKNLRERDPELASINESHSDGRAKRGARSFRTQSSASRGSNGSEYERQIRAFASKGTQVSPSSKSHNSDIQTSANKTSARSSTSGIPQTRARSSVKSSSSSRGKQSTQEIPGPALPAIYISGTIITSRNNITARQKQSSRQTPTSPLSPIKKSGTIITSNSKTTSASVSSPHNPPASPNLPTSSNHDHTIDYPIMSRQRQILPGALPSPTSPIHKSGTITLSNSTSSGANYTHSSAQTHARPTSMTLTEVKRLEDIFGITISVTEPKERDDDLGGRWHGSRLLRIASIVLIAFFMGLTEAWLVGVWYSNVYGGI